jgi:hypothetical protein
MRGHAIKISLVGKKVCNVILPRDINYHLYYAWNVGSYHHHILSGSGITGKRNKVPPPHLVWQWYYWQEEQKLFWQVEGGSMASV